MSSTYTEMPSIAELAKQISDLSTQITSYLSSSSQPEPSFSASSSALPETVEYEALRAPLNDAALDLLRLVNGPKRSVQSYFLWHYDLAALQVALDRGFFNLVPLPAPATKQSSLQNGNGYTKEEISVKEIAEKAGMDTDRTARILRLLATHRIFEPVAGESESFKHTAASALFARDEGLHALADMQMDDHIKAVAQTSTLIKKSPYVSNAENSGFFTAHGMRMYDYYDQNPLKGKRFAQAMSGWLELDRQVSDMRDAFRWESLKDGTVVDVGGGSGHISMALAKQYPSLRFIVQDLSPVQLSQAQDEAFHGRITFQQHNFFEPQPVQNADAFLVRQVLHNYNDADCIKIIRAVVPALEKCKPGTPFLVNDIIMPRLGTTTRYEEHHLRQVDICMLVLLGAKQRSEEEFGALFKEADPRFEIVKVYNNPLGAGMLELHLRRE